MKPTRMSQPYRAGRPRQPGAALTAMLRGRSASGGNLKDIERAVQGLVSAGKRTGRPKRPPRPPRPARPPRY